jgi:hypothetical protein
METNGMGRKIVTVNAHCHRTSAQLQANVRAVRKSLSTYLLHAGWVTRCGTYRTTGTSKKSFASTVNLVASILRLRCYTCRKISTRLAKLSVQSRLGPIVLETLGRNRLLQINTNASSWINVQSTATVYATDAVNGNPTDRCAIELAMAGPRLHRPERSANQGKDSALLKRKFLDQR